MTAGRLAKKIGIDQGHLSRIITGKFNPSPVLAKKIAKALESNRSYLNL
jgi:transcriptional regulator with XRE-family HTH domain